MNIIKIFDYIIVKIFNFYSWSYDKHKTSFNTGGVAFFISLFIGMNLLTLQIFLIKKYNNSFFGKTWPLMILYLVLFFLINEYAYRVVTNRDVKTVSMPKYTIPVIIAYISITIGLFYYAFVYYN